MIRRSALRKLLSSPPPPVVAQLPMWRQAMTANTWAEIPTTNTIASLDPEDNVTYNPGGGSAAWHGSDGQRGVIDAWSGAVFDPDTDTMVVWGGGHGNYYGNEPYKITLNSDSPSWSMIYPPGGTEVPGVTTAYYSLTSPAPASNGTYPDGKPRSQHTYDKIVFAGGYMWLVRNSGGAPDGALGDSTTWRMNISTGDWESVASFGSVTGRVAVAYDSSRNRLYSFEDADDRVGYLQLDNTGAGWTFENAPAGANPPTDNWYLSAEYLPDHDLFVIVAGRQTTLVTSSVLFYDPTNNTYYQPSLTGADVTGTLINFGYSHPAYVEGDGIYLWDNVANTQNLIKLTPGANPRTDACVKSIVTPDGGSTVTPVARATEGTYGRFQYSPTMNGFHLINDVAGPSYFYALS